MVFKPNQASGSNRKDNISTKKLKQGDTAWSTRKVILGQDVYTRQQHLHLLP